VHDSRRPACATRARGNRPVGAAGGDAVEHVGERELAFAAHDELDVAASAITSEAATDWVRAAADDRRFGSRARTSFATSCMQPAS
jgi:hypothetical protein